VNEKRSKNDMKRERYGGTRKRKGKILWAKKERKRKRQGKIWWEKKER
jgi:hypothetical protein